MSDYDFIRITRNGHDVTLKKSRWLGWLGHTTWTCSCGLRGKRSSRVNWDACAHILEVTP